MKSSALEQRIRDRLSTDWMTPSEQQVWEQLHRFDGPPHRVVNIFGPSGSGKSFLGWLMERERYATYGHWASQPKPVLPRLVLDSAYTDQASTRALRPLVDEYGIHQIILLSRHRVDERAMPVFELQITADDLECVCGNLYRYLDLIVPASRGYRNYHDAITAILEKETP